MFIKYSISSLVIYRSILFISLDYNGIKNMGNTEKFHENPWVPIFKKDSIKLPFLGLCVR